MKTPCRKRCAERIEGHVIHNCEPRDNNNIFLSVFSSHLMMPRETGGDGRQLHLPTRAASDFFGVKGGGSSKSIQLAANQSSVVRTHTMTVFKNNTVRIVVSDLEYRDRPCVLVFRKLSEERFQYEIVSKSIFPSRYKRLLSLCKKQTRSGSRRWGIA